MIGQFLAHYEVTGLLGKGGMGEVYRARDTKLDREVALKLLPLDLATDLERLARFQREAKVLASLNHPNIAGIHGLEEADGKNFLVMELAEGEDLAVRLQDGPLPTEEALDIARQIAAGLKEAHEKNIVHRDLKPANIMVAADGKVKILDFGLARAYSGDSQDGGDITNSPTITAAMTQAGTILGTAAYMSPEQAKGKTLDRRTDIWALGSVLWEMLTGERLFENETVSETIASVLRQDPPWEQVEMLPRELRNLLRRCLQRDPDQRLRDAADIGVILSEIRAGMVSGTFSAEAFGGTGSSGRSGIPTWIWGLVIVLVLACGSLGFLAMKDVAPTEAPSSLRVSINLGDTHFLIGGQPTLALSSDGTRMAYAAIDESGRHLYVRDLESYETRKLPGTLGGTSPSFSPDDRWLIFSDGSQLMKISLDGGSPTTLAEMEWYGPVWTESDEIIFGAGYNTGLFRVSASGGSVEALTHPDSSRGHLGHWWPQILPGDEWVLFSAYATPFDSVSIQVFSLRTGEQRELMKGGTYARYTPTGHLLYVRDSQLIARRFDVERMEFIGSSISVLDDMPVDANDGLSHYAFSRSGTMAYVPASIMQAPRQLVWMDFDGVERPFGVEPRRYRSPRLSPDGKRMAVTIQTGMVEDVWILDRERNTWSRFTSASPSEFNAHWTPDGEYIYFNRESPQFDIFRRRSDFSAEAELVRGTPLDKVVTDISRDGEWLLFTESSQETLSDIWAMPLQGDQEARPFLSTRVSENKASFSANGKWIAHVSDESGREEVYVRPFPGRGRPWQISTDGGDEPHWSRDGRYLYYSFEHIVYRVSVNTDGGFEAGLPEQLFTANHHAFFGGRSYDLSPDGERMLMVLTPSESLPRSIRVMTNWFEELERRAP